MVSTRFLKYALTGILALVADYLTFLIMFYVVGAHVAIATIISQSMGLLVSYILNRVWTFNQTDKKPALKQFIKFFTLFIFNTLFSYVVLKILITYGVKAYIAKLIVIACIVTWNYFIYKKLIF